MKKTFTAFLSLCCLCLLLVGADAGSSFYLGGGTKATLVTPSGAPLLVSSNHPPLEGPLTHLAFTVTDEHAIDVFDSVVSAHLGLAGDFLPAALTNTGIAVLDSGAATTIISYPDKQDLGVVGSFVTDSVLPVGGIGGSVDVDVSFPIGIFAHGVQNLRSDGTVSNALLIGQGNFPCGVNNEFNYLNGSTLPTVIGAPFLAYYPVGVKNSERIEIEHRGDTISTASVTIYSGPTDPTLPSYGRHIFLELVPAGLGSVGFLASPDLINGGYTFIFPALIDTLGGSLFRTASAALTVSKGAATRPIKMVVDTAAQATIISAPVAADLGLDLLNPPFEIELQGFSGATETVPGAFLDELYVPTSGNALVWSNVPVVVKSLAGPDGATIDGIFGSNLLGNRDFVFNGAEAPDRYLDVSDPVVFPSPEITAIRETNNTVEVDWLSHPAPPMMCLEGTTNIQDVAPFWTVLATGELATITGTMSVTGDTEYSVFRLSAP